MTMIRVRATIQGLAGLPGLSTFYFQGASTPPTVPEASDATGRVRAVWAAMPSVMAAGSSVLVQQSVDYVDPATGALLGRVSAASAPTVVNATGTGELPPSTAAGLRLNTAVVLNRRLVQGRSFFSPLALAASTSGVPSASLVTQLGVAGAALFTGATAIVPTVWHRPTPGGSNGSTAPVASTAADTAKLWVLRSRRD